MSLFQNLHKRVQRLHEVKQSPYSFAHPSFSSITSHMRGKGLSSAPLDTIKFIREILYYLDIIDDTELMEIKRGPGFTGKKQALLKVLKAKQGLINDKKDEISDKIANTLDDFINGVGVNRGREEQYAAQAVAKEITVQMRQVKSGKEMDDALTDIVGSEKILVQASVAKILHDIQKDLGEPGFDIEEEAIEEVIEYSSRINSLADLKSFISQIANEPGYEKIAAYLSSAVKPIASGSGEGMIEDEEDNDLESFYDPTGGTSEDPEDDYDSATRREEDNEQDMSDVEEEFINAITDDGSMDFVTFDEYIGTIFGLDQISELDSNDRLELVRNRFGLELEEDGDEVIFVGYVDNGEEDSEYVTKKRFNRKKADLNKDGKLEDWERAKAKKRGFTESYTSNYVSGLPMKYSRISESQETSESFKERMKPKTYWQLLEARRYGL